MGIDELRGRASVSFQPLSGTAKPIEFASMLPVQKAAREVFWTECLLWKMEEFSGRKVRISANADDSHGNHDVIVEFQHGSTVGIQVTEMTHEFQRKRTGMRQTYTEKLLAALQSREITSQQKVVISLSYSNLSEESLKLFPPTAVAEQCERELTIGTHSRRIPTVFGSINFHPVEEGEFCVPSYGNIGVAVNIDLLPRTVDTYLAAIDYLAEKKRNSLSQWLLIWSVSFWQDKDWLGDTLIQYMRDTFRGSKFEQVFFLESLDGDGVFQANLTLNRIKT